MKLFNGILRPGIVLKVLENGIIKASAPGLFSMEDCPLDNPDEDKLPPIHPFNELIGCHANSFSKPEKYDEVWVLNFTDNPMQLYWFRKDEHDINNSNIDTSGTHVEILCNREAGCSWASLYFTDGSGWTISYNDGRLWIDKDGHIELGMVGTPHRTITIQQDGIHLGDAGGAAHPVAYGDKTVEMFNNVFKIFMAAAKAAATNPYTATLAPAFLQAAQYVPDVPDLKSIHVKID